MKKSASEFWTKFRKNVPGKVQLSILLVAVIVGVAVWAGWVDPGLDHFVIEAIVSVALFVYAVFVALELDDHYDRTELLGVMLSYVLFNFYVSYNLTGQNTEIPIIGGQMAGTSPDLVQLGQWMVVVGVIGLAFNLVVDRDTALSNLAWHWRNNPVIWLLRPIPRDFASIVERWQKRFQGLSLPERPQLRRKPDPASSRHKRPAERRPERRERKDSE